MTKVMTADTEDIALIESAWERSMNFAGMDQYEERRFSKNGTRKAATEMVGGQKLMKILIRKATEGIAVIQKEIVNVRRTDRTLRASALALAPDTTALIGLKVLIDATYAAPEPEIGTATQSVCTKIGGLIEQELNFQNWISESKKQAKEWAKENDKATPISFAENLIKEEGANARSWRRWKHSFDELSEYQWNIRQKSYCGEVVMTGIVNGIPDAFDIYMHQSATTKHTKKVRMLPTYRERFDQIEASIAAMQVIKKPMLARPQQWKLA